MEPMSVVRERGTQEARYIHIMEPETQRERERERECTISPIDWEQES